MVLGGAKARAGMEVGKASEGAVGVGRGGHGTRRW